MHRLRSFTRSIFDVREGEWGRTVWMTLYLVLVLFAYYILKPVSRAEFLNALPLEALPVLYILTAAAGGVIAYIYTKTAIQVSLKAAIRWTIFLTVASLLALWWILPYRFPWMYYVFNVWVSLFGIILVSQGWLIAANVFDSREAKRLYGILATGGIFGAAFGGEFTAFTVRLIGPIHLLLACAVLVLLAYGAYRMILTQPGVNFEAARGGDQGEIDFSFRDITMSVSRHRHLQVIVGIILFTYIVDQLVEYQFNAAAKLAYQGNDLTSFLGSFFGLYLNLASFLFQLLLTAAVVRSFGVAGTLQIMPALMALASMAIFALPGLYAAAAARLAEASLRYSVNRTGMELLYLPLPADLKNRTKAFVDIFVDRAGRGIAGVLLIVLNSLWAIELRYVALVSVVLCVGWLGLSIVAHREYVRTVRRRLEARRLDLAEARVAVDDPAVLKLLEEAACGENSRQACYALTALSKAPGYDLHRLLERLIDSPLLEVRSEVYDRARSLGLRHFHERAWEDIEKSADGDGPLLAAAIAYVIAVAEDWREKAVHLLASDRPGVVRAALESLAVHGEEAAQVVDREWLAAHSIHPDPEQRALAAYAIGVRGDRGTEALFTLLSDPAPEVAAAACRAAGRLQNRTYASALIPHLARSRTRGAALEALVSYGEGVVGLLSDVLNGRESEEQIRRQAARALGRIPGDRSAGVLLDALEKEQNPVVRTALLKGLNKIRDAVPNLAFDRTTVHRIIQTEARKCFELCAAVAPLRSLPAENRAMRLLERSVAERRRLALERLFRALGLRYPQRQIHAAYQAICRSSKEQLATATDFLENVLDREHKRLVLPLLDEPALEAEAGRSLFAIAPMRVEEAVAALIGQEELWLPACAMAVAVEADIASAVPAIRRAERSPFAETAAVAKWALGHFDAQPAALERTHGHPESR